MRVTYLFALILLVHLCISIDASRNDHLNTKETRIVRRAINKHSAYKSKKINGISISAAVDDIKESTDFADREKKWRSMMEGDMYPEHMLSVANYKDSHKGEIPHIESADADDAEEVVGSKKTRIENHALEGNEKETFNAEGYDDSNSDDSNSDDSNDFNESGSGSANENEESQLKSDDADENETEKEGDDSFTGDRREEKLQCHRKCSLPMTYHECAHPRCSMKMGTIKDLCFYLCKHQKERCEDVCE